MVSRGDLCLPVEAETPGVQLLSGFSAAMFRELLAPEAEAATVTTPAAKLRATLHGARYDSVREAVAEVGEGVLAGYRPAR